MLMMVAHLITKCRRNDPAVRNAREAWRHGPLAILRSPTTVMDMLLTSRGALPGPVAKTTSATTRTVLLANEVPCAVIAGFENGKRYFHVRTRQSGIAHGSKTNILVCAFSFVVELADWFESTGVRTGFTNFTGQPGNALGIGPTRYF